MKILIIGAGAIGTYLGVSLHAAGADVAYLESNPSINNLEKRLTVILPSEILSQQPANFYSSAQQAFRDDIYDLILLAVKAYHVESAVKSLLPFKPKINAIACVQNGIGAEKIVREKLPEVQVIALSLITAVTRVDANAVKPEIIRGLGVDTNTPAGSLLFEWFDKTGLKPRRIKNPVAMKWSKMVTNLFSNATSAILDFQPGRVYQNIDLFKIEREQIVETIHVMKKANIPLINLPGLPVRLLVFMFTKIPLNLSQLFLSRLLGSGRGEKMPSLLLDLKNGKPENEVLFLNGAVATKGRELGITTPVNQTLNDVLMGIVDRKIDWEQYRGNPERLIDKINICKIDHI